MLLDLVLVGLAVSAAALYIVRLLIRRVRGRAAACSCASGGAPAESGRGPMPGGSACGSCSGCPYSASGSCPDTAGKVGSGNSCHQV